MLSMKCARGTPNGTKDLRLNALFRNFLPKSLMQFYGLWGRGNHKSIMQATSLNRHSSIDCLLPPLLALATHVLLITKIC